MNENLSKKFGKQVRFLRKSYGISQEKLAEMIDISPRQLSRIECGINFINADILDKLSCYFETDPTSLFAFDYESQYKRNSDGYIEKSKISQNKDTENNEFEKIKQIINENCNEMSSDIKKLNFALQIVELIKQADFH